MEKKYNKDLKKGDIMYSPSTYSEEIWKYEITKVIIKDSVVVAKVKDLYKEMGCSYIIGFTGDVHMRDTYGNKCYHETYLAQRDIERHKEETRIENILYHKKGLEELGLKVTITT